MAVYIRADIDHLTPNPAETQALLHLSVDAYQFTPHDDWEWDPFNFDEDDVPITRVQSA